MFGKEAEETFRKNYPEYICGKELLSPYYDLWQDGAEYGYNKANEWHYVKDELPPEPEIKDGISYPLTYICAYRIRDNGYETGDFMYMGNGEFLGENKEYPIYAWLSPSVTIPEFKE